MVDVSSSGHLRSPGVFDDLDYDSRVYDPFSAYGQSKTTNIPFAVGPAFRWAGDYIERAPQRFGTAGVTVKSPEQGAATSVLLAASPTLAGVIGRYLEEPRGRGDHQPDRGRWAVVEHVVTPTEGCATGVVARGVPQRVTHARPVRRRTVPSPGVDR